MKKWFKNPFSKEEEQIDIEKDLKYAILAYKEETLDDKLVVHFVQDVLFDSKFKGYVANPNKELADLYKRALSGDETVLRSKLFREMRKQRDRNALKISTIIKNKSR